MQLSHLFCILNRMDSNRTKNILIAGLALALVILFLLKDCSGSEGDEVIKVERVTDTIRITTIDTIPFVQVEYSTNTVYVHDTVYQVNDSIKFHDYTTSIEDSLLSGTISTRVAQQDTNIQLLSQQLQYTPKFPQYIYRTDSIIIKDSVTVTKEKKRIGLLLGADFVAGSNLGVAPKVGWQFKNGHIVEGGYDPFNKNVHLGFRIRLGK